jgi:hypothetical protein
VGGYVKKFSLFCEILTTYSVLFAFFIVSHFKIHNYLFLERGPHGLDIRKEKGDCRIVIAIKAKTPFKVVLSMDEGTLKSPIPKFRLYWSFLFGEV